MLKLATKFVPNTTAFENAHRAGFRNAEIWLDAAVLAGWPTLAAIARAYPMEYVLHFPTKGEQTPETLEHAVELYRALGCRCMVIHQQHIDRQGEALLRLEPKLRLAVENHRLTPEQFESWAERNPGLNLDVEHLWMFTHRSVPLQTLLEEAKKFLERYHKKLRHIHLPGYVPGADEHRPMYCNRDLIFGMLTLLQEFHFDGLIVGETNPEYQNANELRMDVLLFDSWREQRT